MSTESTFTVVGMTCAHCVRSVTEEIAKVDGVSHVVVDLASGRVTVTSDVPVDAAVVAAAVDEAGYGGVVNAGAKVGLYGLVLAAIFAGGAAIGAAVGPIDVGGADAGTDMGSDDPMTDHGGPTHGDVP